MNTEQEKISVEIELYQRWSEFFSVGTIRRISLPRAFSPRTRRDRAWFGEGPYFDVVLKLVNVDDEYVDITSFGDMERKRILTRTRTTAVLDVYANEDLSPEKLFERLSDFGRVLSVRRVVMPSVGIAQEASVEIAQEELESMVDEIMMIDAVKSKPKRRAFDL
jgi:hypothetical protein